MMHIDTLSIARDLKATELPAEQAEAIAAAIGRSVTDSVASKGDLENARIALKADAEQVRLALEAKIEVLRTEIERARNTTILWLISSQVALGGLIMATIRFL